MAWRPLYQPQLAHTRCDSLTAPHWSQTLRGVEPTRQAAARRLRVLDLDVRFLGTAMRSRLAASAEFQTLIALVWYCIFQPPPFYMGFRRFCHEIRAICGN